MMGRGPDAALTIGLPVRNGERFLEAAVDALLAQTFTDFELVICDGGSTDTTPDIALRLAGRDRRVRPVRGPTSGGVPANFAAAFGHARGRYFKWAADDDLHHPSFVERCVRALEADPTAVAAVARARSVDEDGRVLRPDWGLDPALGADEASVRFGAALAQPRDPIPLAMFAVMRTEALRRSALLWPVPEFDLALVAELALHGRLVEVDEVLFDHLDHRGRSGTALAADGRGAAHLTGSRSHLPHWHLLGRHLTSVRSAPHGSGRLGALGLVGRWAVRRRSDLAIDLVSAAGSLPLVGGGARGGLDRLLVRQFERRAAALRHLVEEVTSPDARLVVVDGDVLDLSDIGGRPCRPLQPADAADGSIPAGDPEAIAALDDRIAEGATHLVVAWTAEWVLDYHRGLAARLRSHHRPVATSAAGSVFELAPGPSPPP
jgi:hypothetical protein